jgi:hypothetical protein
MLGKYHGILRTYLHGILHPEDAINSANVPKAPNYVSIPTSNITFREAFDILPDKDGQFLLYWTPNFLCSQEGIDYRTRARNFKYSYSRNWLGGYDNNYNCEGFNPIPAYTPPASFKKYRLVSAGCKITYKGSQLNRAGIISHCLTYRSIPVSFFVDQDIENGFFLPYSALTQENRGKFGEMQNVDMTTIQNGMWNGVKNVQQDKTTFVVAVPTDPSDHIFEDDAFFYAAATQSEQPDQQMIQWRDGNDTLHTSFFINQQPEDGTPCSYIFRGEGLSTTEKLYVEQYYNFEVIPTELSAPILRPTPGLDRKTIEDAFNNLTSILQVSKGQSVPDQVINQIIKDNSPGSQALAQYENQIRQQTKQFEKALSGLRRKTIGPNPEPPKSQKVQVEPIFTNKQTTYTKQNQAKSKTQAVKDYINDHFIKNSILDGEKWKRNFNNTFVKPVQWVKNNPDKAAQAATLIQRAFRLYMGGGSLK